ELPLFALHKGVILPLAATLTFEDAARMKTDWSVHRALGAYGVYLSDAGTKPGVPVHRDDDGWVWLSGGDAADVNMAGVLAGPGAPRALANALTTIGRAGVPALILVEDPAALAPALADAGLSVATEMPMMVWEGPGDIAREDDV